MVGGTGTGGNITQDLLVVDSLIHPGGGGIMEEWWRIRSEGGGGGSW